MFFLIFYYPVIQGFNFSLCIPFEVDAAAAKAGATLSVEAPVVDDARLVDQVRACREAVTAIPDAGQGSAEVQSGFAAILDARKLSRDQLESKARAAIEKLRKLEAPAEVSLDRKRPQPEAVVQQEVATGAPSGEAKGKKKKDASKKKAGGKAGQDLNKYLQTLNKNKTKKALTLS